MIGQYPGMTPELNGPSSKECRNHIEKMVCDANISLFCCLQSEVPSQEDDVGWNNGDDGIYLEPEYVRREFPRPFTRYGPVAQSLFATLDSRSSSRGSGSRRRLLEFVHNPIEDLSVPTCNDGLLSLLSRLLDHLEGSDDDTDHNYDDNDDNYHQKTIYLHCWGGRGRAGLVGSCLVSLLLPEVSSQEILDWVQRGYDTRLGAESMSEGLRRSPQTKEQRLFVREFVDSVHAEI